LKGYIEQVMGIPLRGYDYVDIPHGLMSRESYPKLYKMTRAFGCSPDLQDGEVRSVPVQVKRRLMREAGMHLHLQLPERMLVGVYKTEDRFGNTMLMERGTTLLSVVKELAAELELFHRWDHPNEVPWYRSPGCYRIKEYGIEYRSVGAGVLNDMTELSHLITRTFGFLNSLWR